MKNENEILTVLKDIATLLKSNSDKVTDADEQVWTIEEASVFLKLSKPDIYAKISEKTTPDPEKRIPHHRKGHKTIYFLRSQLLAWVKNAK